ncbi:NAD(P)-dependent oxidoreductase [Thalassospira sp. HF15]|uniref:NAD(P)-dependent oxidoreductase n=1 Tax=Thalassospira sp. HF15 TaxID=2722755 RepID=UPI00142F7823|nr:NAD(P)-dependent oxidoreductase [Thalassospira sp. HF15]NIY75674.1 NAD(P)-dependent oxidoreductase [Thalassospira sp. HF15]
MTEKMLKFVHLEQKYPHKREASERRTDFNEIYEPFEDQSAADQSARCSQCGVPFCQAHCPLYNNIPDWLRLTTEGRMEEAYAISAATNNMPEVTGRICPQDRLCEGNCVIEQSTHGAVTIGSVEKYITDTAFANGWVKPPKPTKENGMSVGIIGGGPGGMAAAEQLRLKGYEVHIYDRYDRMGGLLVYGIPGFKLEKDVVERRVKLLEEGGVIMHTEFEVGRDATLEDLRKKHDSVLIATGVYKARDLKLPGAGLENVYPALEYLTTSNRHGLGDKVPAYEDGTLNAKDKNVVVIGGGDTAMDCVRTAIRQGAKSVKCLYRRDRANMPGSQREVANAEEEGVEFVWLTNPEAFVGDDKVTGVRAVKMRLGAPDAGGRQSPEIIEGSSYTMDADMVILALGFEPEDLPTLFDAPELGVSRWGTVKIDFRTMMTNLDGVFAAGDIARGASLVVWAIRDGRDAADRIDEYLLARKEAAA